MAISKLPDGRWIVYYRDKTTKKIKKEYFGRGLKGKNRALQRNRQLGFDKNKSKGQKSEKSRSDLFQKLIDNKINTKYFLNCLESPSDNTESVVKKIIEKKRYTNIAFEVPTKCGVIDVLTNNEIIEIKPIKSWKHALGQVLAYKIYIPDKKLRIYLHGDCTRKHLDMIKLIYKNYDVETSFYGNLR